MEKTYESILNQLTKDKIGFLGVGQMGSALLLAFKKYFESISLSTENLFYLFDPNPDIKKGKNGNLDVFNFLENSNEVFQKSKFIFICVKPNQVKQLLTENSKHISNDTVLVSICAGISIEYMEGVLRKAKGLEGNNDDDAQLPKIIRIMTNHLCFINEGTAAYCVNSKCSKIEEELIVLLLRNVGTISKIGEENMNAFTSFSGSGPAFIYYFVEGLIDAGLKNGLTVGLSREVAINMLYGAAKYLKETNSNPNEVKYIVTTPNGTTIAGLTELDKYRMRYAVNQAVTSGKKRADEIEADNLKNLSKF